jgi:hypothetical protein
VIVAVSVEERCTDPAAQGEDILILAFHALGVSTIAGFVVFVAAQNRRYFGPGESWREDYSRRVGLSTHLGLGRTALEVERDLVARLFGPASTIQRAEQARIGFPCSPRLSHDPSQSQSNTAQKYDAIERIQPLNRSIQFPVYHRDFECRREAGHRPFF